MTKTIYFQIDELARDAVVAANVKKLLKKHNIEIVYGNKKISETILPRCPYAFDAAVLPKPQYFTEYHPDVTKPFPPVVVLLTEAVGALTVAEERLTLAILGQHFLDGDTRWVDKMVTECIWGQAQLRTIKKYHPELLEKVIVTGHPRLDRRCVKQANPSIDDNKIKVGFISRSDTMNPFDARSNIQMLYQYVCGDQYWRTEDRNVEDVFYTGAMDIRILLQTIQDLDPETHKICVRPHPRENRNTWLKLVKDFSLPIEIAQWDQPFLHWVHGMDHLFGPASTSYYDCLAVGKVPICTNYVYPSREQHTLSISDDNNEIINCVHTPRSYDELLSQLKQKPMAVTVAPEAIKTLEQEADYPNSSKSLDKVAQVCIETLNKTSFTGGIKKKIDRARFEYLKGKYNRASIRRNKKHGKTEQGGNFALNAKRISWIDDLAGK